MFHHWGKKPMLWKILKSLIELRPLWKNTDDLAHIKLCFNEWHTYLYFSYIAVHWFIILIYICKIMSGKCHISIHSAMSAVWYTYYFDIHLLAGKTVRLKLRPQNSPAPAPFQPPPLKPTIQPSFLHLILILAQSFFSRRKAEADVDCSFAAPHYGLESSESDQKSDSKILINLLLAKLPRPILITQNTLNK